MAEMAMRVGGDGPILRRVATAAAQMAVGAGFVLEPASGVVISYTAMTSPAAAISVKSAPARPSFAASAPGEVREFATAHGLGEYLENTGKIVAESFQTGARLTYRLEDFPDYDEPLLIADVAAPLTVEELLSRYDRFLDRWIEEVPAAARRKIRVTVAVV